MRPLGHVIYFMPPYIINEDELRIMAEVAWDGIQQAVKD